MWIAGPDALKHTLHVTREPSFPQTVPSARPAIDTVLAVTTGRRSVNRRFDNSRQMLTTKQRLVTGFASLGQSSI